MKPFRSLAYAIGVSAVAIQACRAPTEATTPLDVTVSIDRTVVSQTVPVGIVIKVVNRGTRTVQIADPRSYACTRAFAVLDPEARPVALPAQFCLAIAYAPVDLRAGDTINLMDRWSADESNGTGQTVAVAPGRYAIVARVIGDNQVLGSAPVAVTVVDP